MKTAANPVLINTKKKRNLKMTYVSVLKQRRTVHRDPPVFSPTFDLLYTPLMLHKNLWKPGPPLFFPLLAFLPLDRIYISRWVLAH